MPSPRWTGSGWRSAAAAQDAARRAVFLGATKPGPQTPGHRGELRPPTITPLAWGGTNLPHQGEAAGCQAGEGTPSPAPPGKHLTLRHPLKTPFTLRTPDIFQAASLSPRSFAPGAGRCCGGGGVGGVGMSYRRAAVGQCGYTGARRRSRSPSAPAGLTASRDPDRVTRDPPPHREDRRPPRRWPSTGSPITG